MVCAPCLNHKILTNMHTGRFADEIRKLPAIEIGHCCHTLIYAGVIYCKYNFFFKKSFCDQNKSNRVFPVKRNLKKSGNPYGFLRSASSFTDLTGY